MQTVFLKLLNMSITAGWLTAAILLLRPLLAKAPKTIRCALWALVGIRLVCPVSVKSITSLVPSAETVSSDILYSPSPTIHSGISALNSAVNPIISESLAPNSVNSINPLQVIVFVATVVWIVGMAAMGLYALISCLRIRRQVREAVPYKDNIWLCDQIPTPFIFGLFRPRIYLPSAIAEEDMAYVIAHENAHLKRRDHWIKPLGFLLLTVYWFHPLLWVAYLLLCRDIELACDEKVLRELGNEAKRPYSEALLNCSAPRRAVAACPLAFGEVGVRGRIRAVLNYKKPAFWITWTAVAACVAVAVCFLTNPKTPPLPDDTSAQGTVFFYEKATNEREEPIVERYRAFDEKDFAALLKALANEQWVDDYLVDRASHYYDGQIRYNGWIYFSYSQKIVYYDHYFCEVSDEVLQLIRDQQEGSFLYVGSPFQNASVDIHRFEGWGYIYRYRGEYDVADFLLEPVDKRFSLALSELSSYWPQGTYREEGDRLILPTDDGKNTYVFQKIDDRHFRFLANESSPVPSFRYHAEDTEATVCVPNNAVFSLENVVKTHLPQATADIDGDGQEEFCELTPGPTSGLFTITFSAYKTDATEERKYFNTFYTNPIYAFSFERSENGQLYLVCEITGDDPAIYRHVVGVKDGRITLTMDNGESEFY